MVNKIKILFLFILLFYGCSNNIIVSEFNDIELLRIKDSNSYFQIKTNQRKINKGRNHIHPYIKLVYFELLDQNKEIKPATIIGDTTVLLNGIVFPEILRRANIEATVALSFIINKEGIAENIKILFGDDSFGQAVSRVIRIMKFYPSKRKNKPISIGYKLCLKVYYSNICGCLFK